MHTRYHCDRCGWDADTPALREWVGEGCGGVVWPLHVCPECGEEVYQTVVPDPPGPRPPEPPDGEEGS